MLAKKEGFPLIIFIIQSRKPRLPIDKSLTCYIFPRKKPKKNPKKTNNYTHIIILVISIPKLFNLTFNWRNWMWISLFISFSSTISLRIVSVCYILIFYVCLQPTIITKPFVPSIWGRLHEPKENYARSAHGLAFSTHSYQAICLH